MVVDLCEVVAILWDVPHPLFQNQSDIVLITEQEARQIIVSQYHWRAHTNDTH